MSLFEGTKEVESSDRAAFESCSQLVSCIRYQLSDPHEFLSKCIFPTRSYFAFVEGNREYYKNNKGSSWRHSISFAWVIESHHFARNYQQGALDPEVKSPIMSVDNCFRKWHLTMKSFTNATPVQQEVYLTCNYCEDVSISARVEINLYLGTEKVGNDAVTNAQFDTMVSRHLVYTGPIKQSVWEETNEDLLKAYTIQGIFSIAHCCDDELHCFLPDGALRL